MKTEMDDRSNYIYSQKLNENLQNQNSKGKQ